MATAQADSGTDERKCKPPQNLVLPFRQVNRWRREAAGSAERVAVFDGREHVKLVRQPGPSARTSKRSLLASVDDFGAG